MAIQLMKLRNVPDDEVEEVRAALEEYSIDFYETPTDRWGVSMPAIWLRDATQLDRANAVLEEYQAHRYEKALKDREEIRQEGNQRTILQVFLENPGQFLLYLAIVVAVLYFSISPFLNFGK